jgi:hypothetical protein
MIRRPPSRPRLRRRASRGAGFLNRLVALRTLTLGIVIALGFVVVPADAQPCRSFRMNGLASFGGQGHGMTFDSTKYCSTNLLPTGV